jgi:uncharacterized repeat protein (TIGR01451 family)
MSPKRSSETVAHRFTLPARAALVVLGAFVALVALASQVLGPGAAPVIAAPAEESHMAITVTTPTVEDWAAAGPASVIAAAPLSPGEATTTTVTSWPNPSVFGQMVSFTSTTVYAGGPVTGTATVTFTADSGTTTTQIGTASVVSPTGVATVNYSTLSAGTYTITAEYAGDATYDPSTGTLFPHIVNKADTTTALTGSPNPSAFGETVTFTASVTVDAPGSGTPTGTVTFKDGGAAIGTGTLNASGVAVFATCTLDVGIHAITAEYGGDANFKGSTSAPLTQVVDEAEVTVTLESAPNPSVYGQTVTFTATVTSTVCADLAVIPTGVVFFNDRGVTIGTAALNASGVASMTTFSLVAGEHPLTAVYAGDENYRATGSAPLTHTVNKANTRTTLASSDTTPVFGQCITFSATVAMSETVPTPGAGKPTGIVTFQDVFTDPIVGPIVTTIGSGTLNGEGMAGFTTCSLAVGQHTIIATYEGHANFNQSQSAMTFTVDRADTTTGIVDAVPSPSVYGESVIFTALVSPTLPGAGTPTGKVTFKVDGTEVYVATMGFTNPGEARWSTTTGDSTELGTAPGDRVRDITAEYSGDGNFKPSSSATYNQTVNPADTIVQLQIPLEETEFGQEVQMTAFVSADTPGAGTPTGNVTFKDGGTDLDTVDLTSGQATFATFDLDVGSHSITAEYNGDDHFNTGTSDTVDHEVNKAGSETSLESSPNPSGFGQSVTFTATVEAGGLAVNAPVSPTGTVSFTLGTVGTMTDTVDGSGVASVVTDTLPAGDHEVTAEYGGDGNFKPSDDSLTQTVNTIATTTELSGPTSSVVGDTVTFTATVAESLSGDPVTEGDVTFYDSVTVLGTVTLNGSGQATYTTSSFIAGLHPLKAVYNGTPNFQASTSGRLYHTVGAAGSTTTLTSAPASPTVFGQSVTFTATVTGSGGTPTGQVTFQEGAATIDTETLVGGVATLTKSDLSVGTHAIKAVYGGDATFGGSTSNTISHVVNKADTTTAITSDAPDPSVVGQPVVVNFTVSVDAPGVGTPTGNVTVSDGTASCVGTVAAGTCTLTPAAAGAKTLTASYAGDGNFNGSSDTESHQVNSANTTTAVTSSPNPSLPGQNVTLNATVTANPPGSGTPSGTVQFKSNGSNIGGPVALVGGRASTSTSFGSVGAYNVTADYGGDGNFNASSGATTHNVTAAPPDLSVMKTDSPDPVNVGDNLTYVVNVTNNGADAVNVTLVDTLPPEVSFVSATGCTHDGSALGGDVTCNLGSLAGGASTSATIVVNVPVDTPAGTVLSNTARAGGESDTEETTVYRSPRAGDCNGDYAVDLADVWSIVRDIFDPSFQGTSGCDANQDEQVDAGDVPSTVLIMVSGPDGGGMDDDLDGLAEGPALTLPDQVSADSGRATVPVSFFAHGHSITSLAFSVDYDETWLALDPADRDGNGVPDAVIFALPGDFSMSVTFNEDDMDGEVDIFVGDISPPLTSLSNGPIVSMLLDVDSPPGETQGAVQFSADPAASFGNTSGQSVPGTATPAASRYEIYLPMVFR